MKNKQFEASELQVDKDRREILAIASCDSPDRDGEVVLPSGLRKKDSNGKSINYAGRPILWGHDRTIPAIGSILWLKQVGNQILCKYRISDKTDFSNDIFGLIQDDCLKFHSIGFEVFDESPPTSEEIEARKDWAGCRNIIRDFEVMEMSVCNVPCNQYAEVVSKCSTDTQKLLGDEWKEKDCWEFETKEKEEVKEVKEVKVEQQLFKPTRVKQFVLPTPTFARKVKTFEELFLSALKNHSAEELIAKLRGKA